jgi:hypothetical protein
LIPLILFFFFVFLFFFFLRSSTQFADILTKFSLNPLLSWKQVVDIGKKLSVNSDCQVVASIKYIELLGHVMYFPGMTTTIDGEGL